MRRYFTRAVLGSIVAIAGMAQVAMAGVGVGVDVSTPNARVQVDTRQPVPPPVVVGVERGQVVYHDAGRHDNGKHKGHYKKHKQHKKHADQHHGKGH